MRVFARHRLVSFTVLGLIIFGTVFGLGQALREAEAYVQVPSRVSAVTPVEAQDSSCSCPVTRYKTDIEVEGWRLTRTLSTAWPLDTNLKVYRVDSGSEVRFELIEPMSEADITFSNLAMAAFLTFGIVGPPAMWLLIRDQSDGQRGGGCDWSGSGSNTAIMAAAGGASAVSC